MCGPVEQDVFWNVDCLWVVDSALGSVSFWMCLRPRLIFQM